MLTRARLLSQNLASADTVVRLTGGKYQPADVSAYLSHASGLVEAIAGWSRAARYGIYTISEQAPLGSLWTLPIYPVSEIVSCTLDGADITDSVTLENACVIRYDSWDVERFHTDPPTATADVYAGYEEDQAPFPVLLAVATVVDMIMSQTTVGPRELSVQGINVALPSVVQAVKEALGVT